MALTSSYRVHNEATAFHIVEAANSILADSIGRFERRYNPPGDNRGCGPWEIYFDREVDIWENQRIDSLLAQAVAMVMVDALAKAQPNNPLVTGVWHLNPANRDKIPKHAVYRASSISG